MTTLANTRERQDRDGSAIEGSVSIGVPSTLDIFDHHFPRFPVLPGVLILEEFFALARSLLPEGKDLIVGLVIDTKFRAYVRPGDRVDYRVSGALIGSSEYRFSGTATVDGTRVVTVRAFNLTARQNGANA